MNRLAASPPARHALFLAVVAALGLHACSELSDDPLPPAGPSAGVHPQGWLAEDSAAFHGQALRAAGWDLGGCRSCHGEDYAGGIAEASCLTCHPGTPEDCTVCHGTPGAGPGPPEDTRGSSDPEARGVGAHEHHLTAELAEALDCVDCHVLPESFSAPSHIDGDGRAEVAFGARARAGGLTPIYDPATGSCAGTYCHGGGRFGNGVPVVWSGGEHDQAACGTCHDLPPIARGHLDPGPTACDACHGSVVAVDDTDPGAIRIVDPTLHMNGKTDF